MRLPSKLDLLNRISVTFVVLLKVAAADIPPHRHFRYVICVEEQAKRACKTIGVSQSYGQGTSMRPLVRGGFHLRFADGSLP